MYTLILFIELNAQIMDTSDKVNTMALFSIVLSYALRIAIWKSLSIRPFWESNESKVNSICSLSQGVGKGFEH